MRLFHTSACQASSDEEATEQQSATDEEQDWHTQLLEWAFNRPAKDTWAEIVQHD